MASQAQYSQDVFSLRKLSELFDERGYMQNKSISVDGKLITSNSNGNISYSYPLSSTTVSGIPLDVTLSYAGSVAFTAYKRYEFGTVYSQWEKFHQSRPAWIIGVNGFAVQVLSSTGSFHMNPFRYAPGKTNFTEQDVVWTVDGYDVCNRMESFMAINNSSQGYVDQIRLLRSDGSVLELANARSFDLSRPSALSRADLYTGYYYVNEANSSGFGIVEFDSTYWMPSIRAQLPGGSPYPYIPRKLRYYDGSGLEFIFREWVTPYGLNVYTGRGLSIPNQYGNMSAGPTIFYLEGIRSNSGVVTGIGRSRHVYPRVHTSIGASIYDPQFEFVEDSTVGRALTTRIGDCEIGYGDVGLTVEALGRTTQVRFNTIRTSGNAGSSQTMPLATRGYFTSTAKRLAELEEHDIASTSLYESYLGYVTEIIDPEGRVTKFEYEPYTRKYVNYNFPIPNQQGADITLTLNNYRLKKVTEPAASYRISYTAGHPFSGAQKEDTVRNATLNTLTPQNIDYPYYQNNVASVIRKYDKSGALLTTQEGEYMHSAGSGFWKGEQRTTDNIAQTTRTSIYWYRPHNLPDTIPSNPVPRYTELYEVQDIADETTITSTTYSPTVQTRYLWLPSQQTVSVNGTVKSKQTFTYQLDTVRKFGGDARLANNFGIDINKKIATTLNPATNRPLLRDTVEYIHFPLVDTVLTRLDTFLLKFQTIQKYLDSLHAGTYTLPWEYAIYDPNFAIYRIDSTYEKNSLPPIYRMEKRATTSDSNGVILAGLLKEYSAQNATPHYFNDLLFRGNLIADSIIGAGGSKTILKGSYEYTRGAGANLPRQKRNANGGRDRFYYHSYSSLKLRDSLGRYMPIAKVVQNNDSIRDTLLPHSNYFATVYEKPTITEQYVRRYDAFGKLRVDTLLQLYQYTHYGLEKSVTDANGYYTQYEYDKNGRLKMAWLPRDFPPRTGATTSYSGTENITLYGYTLHSFSVDSVDCPNGSLIGTPVKTEFVENLYAGKPVTEIPECPCPPEGTTKKGENRSLQANCYTNIPFANNEKYEGYIAYTVTEDSPLRTAGSIDSIYLALHPTYIHGQCMSVSVAIPQFNYYKSFYFNCELSPAHQDGSVTSRHYIKADLSSIESQLRGMAVGSTLEIYLKVGTPGGGVEFVSGDNGEDTGPKLVLKGDFTRPYDGMDYTLAYSYDDDSLKTTVSAKVDDSSHSANGFDLNALQGEKIRRTTASHYAGADGRLLRSERTVIEQGGTRVDTASYAHTGLGNRIRLQDQDGDTAAVKYDGLGRPTTSINGDGTYSTITYIVARPDSLGIYDQDFYGYCDLTITANEKGVQVAQFRDAFGRLRREVNDYGNDPSNLNLTTKYEYDLLGRVVNVTNPKGQTTSYTHDEFGHVLTKNQPDLGTISYAYDNLGNVRFVQTAEQATKNLLTYTQYDDMNRVTLIGEAYIDEKEDCPPYNEDNPESGGCGDGSRLTDKLDGNVLHVAGGSLLTANRTMFITPWTGTTTFAALSTFRIKNCPLNPEPRLGETTMPPLPLIMHPTTMYRPRNAGLGIWGARLDDFEDVSRYADFARIAVQYDAMPIRNGGIWWGFPTWEQWDKLAPTGKVRNTKGREIAVAYREKSYEPFHYAVMSYDERGRVEALLRWNENLGHDGVYYQYNSANQVIAVTVVDPLRRFTTWYGYDHQGRVDTVWTNLEAPGTGLVSDGTFNNLKFPGFASRQGIEPGIVYSYSKTDRVKMMSYPSIDVLVQYAYNHRKLLDSLVATRNGSAIFTQRLSYDPSGQIIEQSYQHGAGPMKQQIYDYDRVQRLTSWELDGVTTGYQYDQIGSRQQATRGTGMPESYGYWSGTNRLQYRKQPDVLGNDTTWNYAYNTNGAQTSHQVSYNTPSQVRMLRQEHFGYSFRGLMNRARVRDIVGNIPQPWQDWRYRYGASGEREQRRLYDYENGVVPAPDSTIYPWVYYLLGADKRQLAVYHGQHLDSTQVRCGDGGKNRVYMYPHEYLTYGVSEVAMLVTRPNGSREYKIPDHLGSTRAVLNQGGSTVGTYDNEPFGAQIAVTGIDSRKQFSDKEKDRETRTANHGVRPYDPQGSVFRSPDALWERFPAWSPYSYAANNPLRIIDPSGLDWLLYDGTKLYWYGGEYGDKSELKRTYKASSGKPGSQKASKQRDKENGPIPEGKYTINLVPDPMDPSQRVGPAMTPKEGSGIQQVYWFEKGVKVTSEAWGTMRVRLDPVEGTNTFDRQNFYIHNSKKGFTSGCIESLQAPGDIWVFRDRNPETPFLEVLVDYPSPKASTNGHTHWKDK